VLDTPQAQTLAMSAGTGALGDASRGVPIPFAKKLLVQIGAFVSLTIVCLALWVVYRTLQSIQLSDVLEQFRALPAASVLLAFLLTAGAYFVVSGYDLLSTTSAARCPTGARHWPAVWPTPSAPTWVSRWSRVERSDTASIQTRV